MTFVLYAMICYGMSPARAQPPVWCSQVPVAMYQNWEACFSAAGQYPIDPNGTVRLVWCESPLRRVP